MRYNFPRRGNRGEVDIDWNSRKVVEEIGRNRMEEGCAGKEKNGFEGIPEIGYISLPYPNLTLTLPYPNRNRCYT